MISLRTASQESPCLPP